MSTIHPDSETIRQRLEVEFEIVPPESCSCGVGDVDGEIVDLREVRVDGEHYADLTVSSSGDCCPEEEGGCVIHRRRPVDADCPFRAFYDEGWVPRVVKITDESVRVRTYLPDRDTLSDVVDVLERTAETVQVRKLRRIDEEAVGTESDQVTIDLNGLTEKQRTTAIRAVESGYYDQPRKISFENLANKMGISKSGLSQRLNAVEAKLMKAVFSEVTCG